MQSQNQSLCAYLTGCPYNFYFIACVLALLSIYIYSAKTNQNKKSLVIFGCLDKPVISVTAPPAEINEPETKSYNSYSSVQYRKPAGLNTAKLNATGDDFDWSSPASEKLEEQPNARLKL
jgi:hypothetical protein